MLGFSLQFENNVYNDAWRTAQLDLKHEKHADLVHLHLSMDVM